MQKEKTRNEIKEEYKWDLTKIFKSDEECYKELKECEELLSKYTSFKGKITKSSKNLLDYLEFNDTYERKLYKVYYYAHLHFDEDTTNTKYQELKGKVDQLLQKVGDITSYIPEELMSTDYEVIKKYIDEEPKLETYRHSLDDNYRFQKHILSEEQEKIVSAFSQVLSASEDIYEALTDSDLTFGTITDEEGKEIELTESNYNLYIRSKNRDVRKQAFDKLYEAYNNHKNSIAKSFETYVEYKTKSAKLHNFTSSIEASLFKDNISTEVYDNIINTIHDNLEVAYKYFRLKRELLGLDELHNYDLYCELIEDYNKKYTFTEAKELVLKAMEPLGDDYISKLKHAFSDNWVDVYHNKGKRGGAYSSGFYDTVPYVLLNFEGTLNDVSTLAHEFGHSMHTLYSCENNDYPNSSYQIFVAEVASTVNELLLSKYLLKTSTSPEEKLTILNNLMELFKATIIRQTMFAEFERDVHAARENGEVLTHEFLEDKYFELNKLYFGDTVKLDDEIKYEWSRIPHFYYDFYVYKYVIGLSCACYIVENILEGKENARENYIKFLSSGGSMYPKDELLIAGIDITKKDVIESAINMFDDVIEEFKTINETQKVKKR